MVNIRFQRSSTRRITLAQYILRRLAQYGCHHLHGVPGDFCLPFLSQVSSKESPVKWIGNCNELNAAYAADGYSRITGLGAVCTTYGVGELSAINAVAGSWAERVSIVHLVGMPRRDLMKSWTLNRGRLVHHMLGHGRSPEVYHEMAKNVTAAQVRLNDRLTAREAFDTALTTCLSSKRPVYVELPSDMADEMVGDGPLGDNLPIRAVTASSVDVEATELAIVRLMEKAQKPLIMVDGLSYRFKLKTVINDLVASTGFPAVCLPHGLGIVQGSAHNYCGVYAGSASEPELQRYVNSADLVLLFGPLLSDTNTAGWTAVPPQAATISFHGDRIEFDGQTHPLDCRAFLRRLSKNPIVQTLKEKGHEIPHVKTSTAPVEIDRGARITQDSFYPLISSYFLKEEDTIILANGTPLIGAKLLNLPARSKVIASGIWFSVGHMLPAALGAALAKTKRVEDSRGRVILLEGDGAFQATATELGTIMRYKLDVTIFIVNNAGYAYERLIMGKTADFNDVAAWDYSKVPAAFGGLSTDEYPIMSKTVQTLGELKDLLLRPEWNSGKGLKLVEVVMGREDVPEYFRPALEGAGQKLVRAGPARVSEEA